MKIILLVSLIFEIILTSSFSHFEGNPSLQNQDIIFLSSQNPKYSTGVKNPDISIFADKNISGKIFYIEQFGQFVVLPNHLSNFVVNGDDLSFVGPTSAIVDSYIFVRNSDNKLIQNTDYIDENTKISLVVRTNYATGILNNQDEKVYEKIYENGQQSEIIDLNSVFLNEKFSESSVFLGEEIVGKCEKLRCEFVSEKLPILMKKYLENPENAYWFAEDREYIQKIFFENGKFIIIFQKNANLGTNFIFHFMKV